MKGSMMKSITAQVDWKKKIVILIRGGDEENDIIPIDEAGNIELTEAIFQSKKPETAIVQFEHEIESMLSYEQQLALYANWGSALSIMTTNTANVLGIEKFQAKAIIQMAERYGLLYAGHNCTWKVKDGKIVRARWSDKARSMQKLDNAKPQETPAEIVARFAAMGEALDKKNSLEVEGGRVSTKVLPKKKQVVEKTIDEGVMPENDSSIEILPENPEKQPDKKQPNAELALRLKLKALEHKAKTFTEWSETVTPWTVNSEIQAVKAQLRTLETNKASKQYKQEVNAAPSQLLPKSITRIEQPAPMKSKIVPKKKL